MDYLTSSQLTDFQIFTNILNGMIIEADNFNIKYKWTVYCSWYSAGKSLMLFTSFVEANVVYGFQSLFSYTYGEYEAPKITAVYEFDKNVIVHSITKISLLVFCTNCGNLGLIAPYKFQYLDTSRTYRSGLY